VTAASLWRTRDGVWLFLCALSFILYLDRVCISQAAVPMSIELGLTNTQMGVIFAAFTLAYGLFEIPTGRWGDRYGSRGVLTRIVVWWSVFTILTACVWRLDGLRSLWTGGDSQTVERLLVYGPFVTLVIIRFLFGAGEAGAYPNTARVVSRWFPPQERGRVQGAIITCALVGGAVAPAAVAYLIEAFKSWRLPFVVFGLTGMVWAAAFYWWYRDDPSEKPGMTAAELAALRYAGTAGPIHEPIPWRWVLVNRNVWLLGLTQTCGAFASYLYMFWFPSYLQRGRELSQWEAGSLASLVLAGGAAGALGGGYVADWMARCLPEGIWSRRLLGCGVMLVAAAAILVSVHVDSPVGATLCAACASLFAQSQQATWWNVTRQISGPHLGSLFGLLNSLGVPGAMGSQLFMGRFADWRHAQGFTGRAQWDPAFYVYAAVLAAGACCWLLLDPRRSAVGPHAEPQQ